MDRIGDLEKRVGEIREELAQLKGALEGLLRQNSHPVETLLRQRGFPVLSHGGQSQLLFSPNAASGELSRFYDLMRRYSFRLFLRDLIRFPEGDELKTLTRYCSLKTVRAYLKSLADLGIVSLAEGRYALVKRVPSFGPTLEWFVWEIFEREFLAPALFNVRLQETRAGGDYDVVSLLAGHLVYVEVKSSPPRGVEYQAVEAFLGRVRELAPHVSILLVDTELRMRDKLVPMLEEGLVKEGKTGPEWAVARLVEEIFHVHHSLYVTNSRKGIYTNLRTCFRDFLLWQRRGG